MDTKKSCTILPRSRWIQVQPCSVWEHFSEHSTRWRQLLCIITGNLKYQLEYNGTLLSCQNVCPLPPLHHIWTIFQFIFRSYILLIHLLPDNSYSDSIKSALYERIKLLFNFCLCWNVFITQIVILFLQLSETIELCRYSSSKLSTLIKRFALSPVYVKI